MKIIKSIIVYLVFLSAISCTKKELVEEPNSSRFNIYALIKGSQNTKSIILNNGFTAGSAIGIQLLREDNSKYSPFVSTNIKYEYTKDDEWVTTDYNFLNTLKAKVYGYYPYDSKIKGDIPYEFVNINIPKDCRVNDVVDYLFASPLDQEVLMVNNSSNFADLIMNHSLSQISFIIYKENYTGPGIFTEFSIENNSLKDIIKSDDGNMKMSIMNGSISGGARSSLKRTNTSPIVLRESSVISGFPSSDLTILKQQVDKYGVSTLLAPYNGSIEAEDIQFVFKIDGIDHSVRNTSRFILLAGKQYIFKVKLTDLGAKILSVSISDWNSSFEDEIFI